MSDQTGSDSECVVSSLSSLSKESVHSDQTGANVNNDNSNVSDEEGENSIRTSSTHQASDNACLSTQKASTNLFKKFKAAHDFDDDNNNTNIALKAITSSSRDYDNCISDDISNKTRCFECDNLIEECVCSRSVLDHSTPQSNDDYSDSAQFSIFKTAEETRFKGEASNPSQFDESNALIMYAVDTTLSCSKKLLTGYLEKDILLDLDFDAKENSVKLGNWDKTAKYNNYIGKKAKYFDKLTILPCIAKKYSEKLENIIPNFGSLLRLYSTVDKKKFMAIVDGYTQMNNLRNINIIYLACERYIRKFGFEFTDDKPK